MSTENLPRATFLKRFLAYFYDVLLSVSLYVFAGIIFFCIFSVLIYFNLIEKNVDQHNIDVLMSSGFYILCNELFKLSFVVFYFFYSFTKIGQTVGMKAWNLKLQTVQGRLPSYISVLVRLFFACGGVAILTVCFNRHLLAIHDILSQTEIVQL